MTFRSRAVRALVVGLAAAATALVPTVASAADGGLIAFSTGFVTIGPDLDNPSQVVTVRPDGTHQRQLTHVAAGKQAGAPDISPDRRWIVYVSNQGADNFAVWAMRTDGTRQHRLFGRAGFDYFQPRWSPDGRRLVVTQCDATLGFVSGCALLVTRTDGTHRRVLFDRHRYSGNASFSPDGKWVVFDSDLGGFDSAIWKVRSRGGGLVRLTRPSLLAFWPHWSPNGRHLVLSSNCCQPLSQVFTMRANGSHLRQLTHATGGGGPSFASYAPGGGRIVFTSDQSRGPAFDRSDLWVMRTDGSHAHRIVSNQRNAVGADWSRRAR